MRVVKFPFERFDIVYTHSKKQSMCANIDLHVYLTCALSLL